MGSFTFSLDLDHLSFWDKLGGRNFPFNALSFRSKAYRSIYVRPISCLNTISMRGYILTIFYCHYHHHQQQKTTDGQDQRFTIYKQACKPALVWNSHPVCHWQVWSVELATSIHCKSAKLPCCHNTKPSFWSLSFSLLSFCLFVFLSCCIFVMLSFCHVVFLSCCQFASIDWVKIWKTGCCGYIVDHHH